MRRMLVCWSRSVVDVRPCLRRYWVEQRPCTTGPHVEHSSSRGPRHSYISNRRAQVKVMPSVCAEQFTSLVDVHRQYHLGGSEDLDLLNTSVWTRHFACPFNRSMPCQMRMTLVLRCRAGTIVRASLKNLLSTD